MTCDGVLTFDRRMGWIDRLELNRNESRRPGPIEAGLDVKSTMTMTRAAEPAPGHPDRRRPVAISPWRSTPRSERLLQVAPDGKSFLLHDRHWHVLLG